MLSPREILVLQTLQQGLPLTDDPYGVLAQSCGMSAPDFCRVVQTLKDRGVIRRIGVVLRHYRAGITGNVMAAFAVSEHEIAAVGDAMAQHAQISHCYARKTAPGWPYNLYAMVHAPAGPQAEAFIVELCQTLDIKDYIMLPTVAELKKSSFVFSGV